MLKTLMNRVLLFSPSREHTTNLPQSTPPRLWEYPLSRVLLALLSAAFLICSLPDPDIGWLGWVALVPLMLACQGLGPRTAAGLGLIFGIVASFGIYGWLFEVPSFDMRHAIVLALYVGAYPAAWCAATAWVTRRHAPLILATPALWVAIDYLRAHAGFLALPWGTLAQTQHYNLAILQIASLAGEQAVTFLVVLGNAALVGLILQRAQQGALVAGVVLVLAHLWGASVLSSEQPGPTIRVVAIQPNILIGERKTEVGRRENLERLEQLTRTAAADHPTLIVWPESAIPGNLQSDPVLIGRLQSLSDTIGIPLILGAAEVEKFATGDKEITMNRRVFNTAHLLRPGEPLAQPYRKRMLVPFAEYLPHPDIIPWPEWLAPRVSEMTPGESAQLFNMTTDLSIGALICWENVFAPLARESVRNGAHLLVQLTNDVWFGHSAAPWQHNLMSVMRAVENRVPIVIASNTGPSQIIDGYGRVVASATTIFTKGLTTGSIHTRSGGTVYTAVGDVFVFAVLAWVGMFLVRQRVSGLWTREKRPFAGLPGEHWYIAKLCDCGKGSNEGRWRYLMKWIRHSVLALGLLCITQGLAYASSGNFGTTPPEKEFTCRYSQVAGSFTANSAKYSISGSCIIVKVYPNQAIPWTAQGFYDARTANGVVQEKIVFNGPLPYRGEFHAKMVCNNRRTGASFDPWLWMGDDKCTQIQIQATGEQSSGEMAELFVSLLLNRAEGRGGPVTASFPYDRQPLLAKRQTDLQAEVAKAEKEKRRAEQLLQGATLPSGPSGPYTALIHPSVLEPKTNQILSPQRPVQIKLAPPKGWNVTGYMVTIQRKDPNGTWVNHTSIPIGAIVAHSPTGYTGFGNGAPPAFLMTAGRWRLNAQASSPKQSGVSDWVEFSALESADFTAKKRPASGLPYAGQSVLYGIASTGALKWYRHNEAQTGAGLNTPGAWTGPTDVGTGWQNFKEVFGMGDGIIYAIAGDGKLKWYKHTGFRDGRMAWDGPKDVGTGWQNFKQVFGVGNGVIYAIAGDGILKWYKHTGYQDGSFRWEGPKDVGTGWQNFKQVFGVGNGVMYAIAGDGALKWYKHIGYQDGSFRWEGPKDVGTGWQGFTTVLALLP